MSLKLFGLDIDPFALGALLVSVLALMKSYGRDRIATRVKTMWADQLSGVPDERYIPVLAIDVSNIGHRTTTIVAVHLAARKRRFPFKRQWFHPVPYHLTGKLPYSLAPGTVFYATYDKTNIEKATEGLFRLRVTVNMVGITKHARISPVPKSTPSPTKLRQARE